MTNIRWGIVGAGRIAHTFAQDMPATGNGVVQAVAARSGESATAFADRYGIATAHEGYEALYTDPNVDAIYVATPHNLHLQHASDALRAGKAVLCEKPITVNADECRQLMDIAQETGGYLMEAMWTRFFPIHVRIRELLREQVIGTVNGLGSLMYYTGLSMLDASLAQLLNDAGEHRLSPLSAGVRR